MFIIMFNKGLKWPSDGQELGEEPCLPGTAGQQGQIGSVRADRKDWKNFCGFEARAGAMADSERERSRPGGSTWRLGSARITGPGRRELGTKLVGFQLQTGGSSKLDH